MHQEEIQKYANRLGFLTGLSESDRDSILAEAELRTFAEHEVLYSQGSTADGLYLVVEGEVTLTRTNRSLQNFDLARLEAGDVFGEIGILDKAQRLVTARAETEARVLFLSAESLATMLEGENTAALELLHLLSVLACRKIRELNRRIVDAIHEPGATLSPKPGGSQERDENFFQGLMANLFLPTREP